MEVSNLIIIIIGVFVVLSVLVAVMYYTFSKGSQTKVLHRSCTNETDFFKKLQKDSVQKYEQQKQVIYVLLDYTDSLERWDGRTDNRDEDFYNQIRWDLVKRYYVCEFYVDLFNDQDRRERIQTLRDYEYGARVSKFVSVADFYKSMQPNLVFLKKYVNDRQILSNKNEPAVLQKWIDMKTFDVDENYFKHELSMDNDPTCTRQ